MKVVYYEGINLLKPKWEKRKIGKFIFMFCKKKKKKSSAIVLFHVFVPDEKKNKCQNARAALVEFSSFSVARAATCTCWACGAFPPARIFVLPYSLLWLPRGFKSTDLWV